MKSIILIKLATICLVFVYACGYSQDVLVVHKVRSNANLPGSVAFIDSKEGKIIKTVAVGNEPHEIALSDDGKYALVTNTGSYKEPSNELSLIDIKNQKEKYRIDLGAMWNPHGVFFFNGYFYFTAEGSRVVGAYEPETNKITWINGTGQDQTHMLVMTDDGKHLICTNRGSGTISIFSLKGDDPMKGGAWKENIIEVGKAPEGLTLSPDGQQVWVGLRGGNAIVIVDIETQKLLNTFPINYGVARVKFTLDGKYLLGTDSGKGDLVVIDPKKQEVIQSIHLGESAESIFLLPDNKHVWVGVTNEDHIAEVDLESMKVSRLIHSGKGPDAMVWIGK